MIRYLYLILSLSICSPLALAEKVTLYHASNHNNLNSILNDGLLIKFGGCHEHGSSYLNNEDMEKCHGKIFLASSIDASRFYAMMIASRFQIFPPEDGDAANIFEVVVDSDLLTSDPDDRRAFFLTQDVPPEAIKSIELMIRKDNRYYILK